MKRRQWTEYTLNEVRFTVDHEAVQEEEKDTSSFGNLEANTHGFTGSINSDGSASFGHKNVGTLHRSADGDMSAKVKIDGFGDLNVGSKGISYENDKIGKFNVGKSGFNANVKGLNVNLKSDGTVGAGGKRTIMTFSRQ